MIYILTKMYRWCWRSFI